MAKIRAEDCFIFDFDKARRVLEKHDAGVYQWEKALTGEPIWVARYKFGVSNEGDPLFILEPEGSDEEVFAVLEVPTPTGGMRPYLACSRCSAKARKLFATHVGGKFHCNQCHDLIYDRQAEPGSMREQISDLTLDELQGQLAAADPDTLAEMLAVLYDYVADYVFDDKWYQALQRARYGK